MTAIAAVVGAGAGPLATYLIARATRGHESELNWESRTYEARRTIYEETLAEISAEMWRLRQFAEEVRAGQLRVFPDLKDLRVPDEDVDRLARQRGRLATIASDEIMAAFESYKEPSIAAWKLVSTAMHTGEEGDIVPPEVADEIEARAPDMRDKRRELERRIRSNLQSRRD